MRHVVITPENVRAALAREVSWWSPTTRATAPLPAAVALPIVFEPEPVLYAVLRARGLRDHGGEVGFPGGKPEPEDADLFATAMRELAEEVAVTEAEQLGALSPVPVITGKYLVHPFVVAIREPPRTMSGELEALLPIALDPFLRGCAVEASLSTFDGHELVTPHFKLPHPAHPDGSRDVVLYGASAFMLWELLTRVAAELGVALPPPTIVSSSPWRDRYRP